MVSVILATMREVISVFKTATRANGCGDVGASRKSDTLGEMSQLWQAHVLAR